MNSNPPLDSLSKNEEQSSNALEDSKGGKKTLHVIVPREAWLIARKASLAAR